MSTVLGFLSRKYCKTALAPYLKDISVQRASRICRVQMRRDTSQYQGASGNSAIVPTREHHQLRIATSMFLRGNLPQYSRPVRRLSPYMEFIWMRATRSAVIRLT